MFGFPNESLFMSGIACIGLLNDAEKFGIKDILHEDRTLLFRGTFPSFIFLIPRRHKKTNHYMHSVVIPKEYTETKRSMDFQMLIRSGIQFIDRRCSLNKRLRKAVFTIENLSIDIYRKRLHDPFDSLDSARRGFLETFPGCKTNPFLENPVAILRGISYASNLGLSFSEDLMKLMMEASFKIKTIEKTLLRRELLFMFSSPDLRKTWELLKQTGILENLIPELHLSIGVSQNAFHEDDIAEHSLKSAMGISYKMPFLRIVALLHDAAKTETKSFDEDRQDYIFYGHDQMGAKLAYSRLKELGFSALHARTASNLIREHMFNINPDVKLNAIKRLRERLFPASLKQFVILKVADEKAIDKSNTIRQETRHLIEFIMEIEKEERKCHLRDLAVNGRDLLKLGIEKGPMMQIILQDLLSYVEKFPLKNRRGNLLKYIKLHFLQ